MNYQETERALVLFTGVSDSFFSLCAGAEPQSRCRAPAGQAAGCGAGVPWAGAQAHAARLTDGRSIFSLDDLFQWLIILTQTQDFFFF